MILPKDITIFGNAIDVVEVDCLNEEMGDFSPTTNTIHVARHTLSGNIKCELTPKQKEQAFWREVFHAFQWYATGEFDEVQSQVYAGFMTELGMKFPVFPKAPQIKLYTARSLGCGTTLVAVIAAATPDEALQLIKAERGEGWILTERQVQVTVNIDKPQIIAVI